ncbi:dermonecrotic toxin domain-containing protein [Pseudomonas sp. microsymbiont 2]
MSYHFATPKSPNSGEPSSPEPATHPDSTFELGQYHFASVVPATSEQDEGVVLSIQQVFGREQISLPTPHDYASVVLREYLAQQGIEDDPDDLVLSTLFLEHVHVTDGPWAAQVAHSMTLTQAMVANWQQQGSGQWQDHLGHPMDWRREGYEVSRTVQLSAAQLADSEAYDGIYRRTQPQTYGAATQVNLDPAAFRQHVWDAQLQGRYLEYLRQFWSSQAHDYHLLLKGNLVHAALLQRDEGSLSEEHAALVLESLMLSRDTRWAGTSFRYFADTPVSRTRTISAFRIHGYEATDIMVFQAHGHDAIVLYIPGNSSPLHGFNAARELRDWVAQQCRDPRKRASLASHFSSKDRGDGVIYSGVDTALAGLGAHPRRLNDATGHWYPGSTITFSEAIYPYPMSYFRDQTRSRLFSDADYDIGTQGRYYAKLTAYGVEVTANVVGAIALAVPALAPVAVALGVGLLAVGAGEMITAHNQEEEAEGAQRIVFGLLNALPLAGEVSQLGRVTAALGETERSVAVAAQAEHAAQQALEDAAVAGDVPVSPEELKAVRPVHDSLQHDLRARLQDLAVTRPLRVLGGGKGTFLDEGKLYVRIRPRVYRVQWLEHEQQLRIRSEAEPVAWGPFLSSMEDGYWDLDLRFGLRGGAPLPTVLEHPRLPLELIDSIECQPMVPKVEVSFAVDDLIWNHEASCYEADIVFRHDDFGEKLDVKQVSRQPVWYDADAAAWRRGQQYIWRERHGGKNSYRWRAGEARDFERVRHKLPHEQNITTYRFPDLPQLPVGMSPITQQVHMIWVGERELDFMIKRTIVKNLRNKGYRFILHLDNDSAALTANQAWCGQVGIEARNLREQAFFQRFTAGREGIAYNYFRNPAAESRNYAAASDFLRLRLLDEYGGFYMDIDDTLYSPDARPLPAAPNDVLVGGLYKMPWNRKELVNTSHFASHPGNPVLKRLLQRANARFEALPEAFKSTPRPVVTAFKDKAEAERTMNAYMQTIASLAGPDAFNKDLRALRPDYFGLIGNKPSDSWVVSTVYEAFYDEAIAHWFPMRMGGAVSMQPGSAHTWMRT